MKTKTQKDAAAIVESIRLWLRSFNRKRGKTQVQLIADLEAAKDEIVCVYDKMIVELMLDIMRVNVNEDFTLEQADILDAEFLEYESLARRFE